MGFVYEIFSFRKGGVIGLLLLKISVRKSQNEKSQAGGSCTNLQDEGLIVFLGCSLGSSLGVMFRV